MAVLSWKGSDSQTLRVLLPPRARAAQIPQTEHVLRSEVELCAAGGGAGDLGVIGLRIFRQAQGRTDGTGLADQGAGLLRFCCPAQSAFCQHAP